MGKRSFIIHYDKRPLFEELIKTEGSGPVSYERVGRLFMALCDFAEHGRTNIKMDSPTRMAYLVLSAQITADSERYARQCQANRENGQRGGRPRKQDEEKTHSVFSETEKKRTKAKITLIDTDTDTDTDTVLSNESGRADAHAPAHPRGKYQNVVLSDAEYSALVTDYPSKADEYIERLSAYLRTHAGKTYSDHDWVIRSWITEDEAKNAEKDPSERSSSFNVDDFFEAAVKHALGDA